MISLMFQFLCLPNLLQFSSRNSSQIGDLLRYDFDFCVVQATTMHVYVVHYFCERYFLAHLPPFLT